MEASLGLPPSPPPTTTHIINHRSAIMLGGHLPELLIVLTLALVVFGPKRLPEIGASLGKGIHDFRKGISDLNTQAVIPDPEELPAPGSTSPKAWDHKAG
jgi:TatA/E family protein of Tat protein translocase